MNTLLRRTAEERNRSYVGIQEHEKANQTSQSNTKSEALQDLDISFNRSTSSVS